LLAQCIQNPLALRSEHKDASLSSTKTLHWFVRLSLPGFVSLVGCGGARNKGGGGNDIAPFIDVDLENTNVSDFLKSLPHPCSAASSYNNAIMQALSRLASCCTRTTERMSSRNPSMSWVVQYNRFGWIVWAVGWSISSMNLST
jgi:hypothetical protein